MIVALILYPVYTPPPPFLFFSSILPRPVANLQQPHKEAKEQLPL